MGEGDVNVHCIASYEDVGTLKTLLRSRCCYVEDAVTLKMLERWRCCYVDDVGTFKMLLRWRCCYVEDVVTLKKFLRSRCCYVEDVGTLKMRLRWRCWNVGDVVTLTMLVRSRCCCGEDVVTLKMLLRWRCGYVEDVGTLKMLLRWRCCYVQDVVTLLRWREKRPMCISPMVLWWIVTFLCLSKKPEIPKNTQFLWGKQKWYKLMNLKNNKKHWNTACWTNSWYSHVIGRTQNTNCLPGNPSLYPIYIYISLYRVSTDFLSPSPPLDNNSDVRRTPDAGLTPLPLWWPTWSQWPSVPSLCAIWCRCINIFQRFSGGLQPPTRNQVDQWQEDLMMKSWPTWSNFQACAAIDIKALQEKTNKEHVRSLRLQEVCSKYFNIFQDVQVFCSRPETMEHGFLVGCHRGPGTSQGSQVRNGFHTKFWRSSKMWVNPVETSVNSQLLSN